MNKNKFGQETTWSLYKYQPCKNYPCFYYFWVNPEQEIKFCRSVEDYGFLPVDLDIDVYIGIPLNEQENKSKLKKVIYHSMTDEHLEKGWLIL